MGMSIEEALGIELMREIRDRKSNISLGRCETFDEYRFQCGIIEGLTRALSQVELLSSGDADADG